MMLKTTDVSRVRQELTEKQDHRCAICGCPLSDTSCLDHQHRLSKNDTSKGAGMVRGVLCRDCNCLEGRLWNAGTRHKQFKTVQERIKWLRNLVMYYEHFDENPSNMIHPTEVPKKQVLSKRNFNTLQKLYAQDHPNAKPLEYPKSKHMTKRLSVLFAEYKINPYNTKEN